MSYKEKKKLSCKSIHVIALHSFPCEQKIEGRISIKRKKFHVENLTKGKNHAAQEMVNQV